jgi:hypothetical protein
MTVTISWRTLVAFASGLAIALISVFVFQAWRVDAAPGDKDSTFVPITPCRLIDTRPAPFRIGTQAAFGGDDTRTIQARGTNGNCTIPNDAVGMSMNVTAVNATQATFLTVWPNGTKPTAASLNPTPGQPPTPNAVTTQLSGSGAFRVYNRFGNVDVIIDVNGYYTKTSLQHLRSPWDTIPSGITVTGNFTFRGAIVADNANNLINVPFPAKAPAGLTSSTVNFSMDGNTATTDDDASCTGTAFEPTAPAGKVCIYWNSLGGMDGAAGFAGLLATDGFLISFNSNGAAGSMSIVGSWAYTAP